MVDEVIHFAAEAICIYLFCLIIIPTFGLSIGLAILFGNVASMEPLQAGLFVLTVKFIFKFVLRNDRIFDLFLP